MRLPGEWEQEVPLQRYYSTSSSSSYSRLDAPCRIRQVPGDGNCLFHSISLCLCQAVNGTHWNLSSSPPSSSSGNTIAHGGATSRGIPSSIPASTTHPPPSLDDLYAQSQKLRTDAVACLRDRRRRLFLQGRESLRASELVQAAAQQYGLTAEAYCEAMQQDCVWGGGPEIVALCNLLQRPIHVYELATGGDAESGW